MRQCLRKIHKSQNKIELGLKWTENKAARPSHTPLWKGAVCLEPYRVLERTELGKGLWKDPREWASSALSGSHPRYSYPTPSHAMSSLMDDGGDGDRPLPS